MKVELKFGLLGGAAVSAWLLVASLVGFQLQRFEVVKYSGGLGLALLAVFLWLGIKAARARAAHGALSLEQGWKCGTLTALIAAVVAALFKFAYNHVIHPGWIEKAIAWERERMLAAGAAEKTIARMESGFRAANLDLYLFTLGIAETVIFSTFIALALAAILRRDPAASPTP
ncbi:MAG: DUF4199 domain-containing protein [Verrucomicrobia bacterium]|nr:DUF4199 domain-containing protein [Verrucomicrobiota bacterium]